MTISSALAWLWRARWPVTGVVVLADVLWVGSDAGVADTRAWVVAVALVVLVWVPWLTRWAHVVRRSSDAVRDELRGRE